MDSAIGVVNDRQRGWGLRGNWEKWVRDCGINLWHKAQELQKGLGAGGCGSQIGWRQQVTMGDEMRTETGQGRRMWIQRQEVRKKVCHHQKREQSVCVSSFPALQHLEMLVMGLIAQTHMSSLLVHRTRDRSGGSTPRDNACPCH